MRNEPLARPPEAPHMPDGQPLHWPSLIVALAIMLAGTAYPPLLTSQEGDVDHRLASLVFMAMAAGFVRGVGFVPRWWLWRVLFSGWSCAMALMAAVWLKWLH